MNISFLVSASNTSDCLYKVFDSIENAISDYPIKYTYEILVSSFTEIKYKNVTWVEDKLKKEGNTVQALNSLVKPSSGEYLFLLSDDHMFPDSKPLRVVEYLNSDLFKNRKYKVSGIGASKTISRMGSTAVPNLDCWNNEPHRFPNGQFPEELRHPRFCTPDHRYLIVGYPVFTRETIEKHFGGYVLNPSFKHHWADNWLPFFVGETDGYPLICEDTPLEWCPRYGETSVVSNDVYDYEVFCKLAVKLLKEGCSYYESV